MVHFLPMKELIGKRFGKWSVLGEVGRAPSGKRLVLARCSCGFETVVQAQNLTSKRSKQCKSCGSSSHRSNRRTHGEAQKRTKEYRCWKAMNCRCLNPTDKNYPRYGGAGISICLRWQGPNGYVNFLADMGRRPSLRHTLDRIDNTLGYFPENCRWSTLSAQRRNQERYKRFHPSEDVLRRALTQAGFSSEETTKALVNLHQSLNK